MTKHVIPAPQRARVIAAADRAYDALRGHVGDSYEVAELVRRLAHECWLGGFTHARENPPEAAE